MPTNTYVALATQTLGTAAASVTFSSIPSGYTDLIIVSSQFYVSTGADRYATFQVGNGTVDTGSNYSWTYLDTYGGSPSSGRTANSTYGLHSYTSSVPTTTPLICTMQIQNYSNTTTNKTMLHRFNAATAITGTYVNLWRSTSAINIITISAAGANFATGSTFSLYGIASQEAAAKATGGMVTSDANYYYHTFTSSGTFTPQVGLTCDVLIIGGGGSGGRPSRGGGGGAGGLVYLASQTLSGNKSIVIGGGGTTGAYVNNGAETNTSTNGNDTTFTGLTTAIGGGRGGANDASAQGSGGSGGSGGGSWYGNTKGTGSQGFDGGVGMTSGTFTAGGGGGASAAGTDGSASGNGGNGSSTYSSWGLATTTGENVSGTVYYAGGGSGAVYNSTTSGTAGYGGGGKGNNTSPSNQTGSNGAANTGGGGGSGGAGGSGIVIVRYAK